MKTQKGSSMVEILIAVLFLSLVAVALLQLSVLNINTSSYSVSSSQAEDYAKETLEWLKNEKEKADWASKNGYYCMQTLNWNDHSPCSSTETISGTPFIRNVNLSQIGSSIPVVVTVSWTDSRGVHEIRKDALFGNEAY